MAEAAQSPVAIKYERIDTYKEWQAKQKIPAGHGLLRRGFEQSSGRAVGFEGRALLVRRARRHRRCQ